MFETNLTRLNTCMERASRGNDVTIAFLGGSITQGSLATTENRTYARRVYSWWQRAFPKAEIHYVNGGIGGTTSYFAAARAEEDILMYGPDFVIIDFSVNDEANDFFRETFEGLIRKIICHPSKPAVLVLNNVFYDTGKNAQEYHNHIAKRYGIPWVSIRDTIYQDLKKGIYTRGELTSDGLHPNDRGHELLSYEIVRFLETVKQKKTVKNNGLEDVCSLSDKLPMPITQNAYEAARRLTIREISPYMQGFRADTREKAGHLDCFKNGWIGRNPGDKIIFTVEAAEIGVQYKKNIQRPAAMAELIIDGDMEHSKILDGNFTEDWGDCLYLEPVLYHGQRKEHTVELRIIGQSANEDGREVTPFMLLSLIIA